jgi:mannose-1-phosphate guanylyltransferase
MLLEQCYSLDSSSREFAQLYNQCQPIAIDYAISEKLDQTLVLPASVGWSDIGSWKSIRDIINGYDETKNVFIGNVQSMDTEGSLVYTKNPKKHVAVLGLKDVVVVDTEEMLLITTVQKSEEIKKLVEQAPEDLK